MRARTNKVRRVARQGLFTENKQSLAHDVLLGPPAEEELDEKSADIGIYN